MLAINFVFLFGVHAAAQLTTKLWAMGNVPGVPPMTGSVMGFDGSRTTVVLGKSETRTQSQELPRSYTITFADTYISEYYENFDTHREFRTRSIHFECTRASTNIDANATCTASDEGLAQTLQAQCEKYSRSTEIQTQTATFSRMPVSGDWRQGTVYTVTQTNDYRSNAPDYCSESAIPESEYMGVETASGGDYEGQFMTTYELVLTAGLEKLQTSGAGESKDPTAGASKTSMAGAAPMMTAVPALAGVGAAVAAMFL